MTKNIVFNIAGFAIPLVVAVFAIPVLIEQLSVERFGVLALAWSLIGYFSLFDLGLGRALTKLVAERHSGVADIRATVNTSLALMLGLGIVSGFSLAIASPHLVDLMHISAEIRIESLQSFLLLSLGLPAVVPASGLRGILEAYQEFGLINAVRIPIGVFSYVGPAVTAAFFPHLPAVVAVLVLSRYLTLFVYAWMARARAADVFSGRTLDLRSSWPAVRQGLWMSVSNTLSPLMLTVDRFLIAAVASVALVAYYATPYEIVTKLWLIPAAITGVAFPRFASTFRPDPARANAMYVRTFVFELLLLFPAVLLVLVFGRMALQIWLGQDFANQSTKALELLSIGVLFSSLSSIPFALVQAAGRADWTAKMYMAEVAPYLSVMFLLTSFGGIQGAAIAWTGRMAVELVITILLARRITGVAFGRGALLTTLSMVSFALVYVVPEQLPVRILGGGIVMLGFLATTWRSLIDGGDRARLRSLVRRAYR